MAQTTNSSQAYMKKIKQYNMLSRTNYILLSEDVNRSIKAGFQPYGNPYSDGTKHYQAMVAYEE